MSLENWELSFSPNEQDKKRWRLKLKIDEKELPLIIGKMPPGVSQPFLLEGSDYDFGLYMYRVEEEQLEALCLTLKEECPDGKVQGQGEKKGKQDGDLSALLEKVAQGLDSSFAPAAPSQSPPAEQQPQRRQAEYVPPPAPVVDDFQDLELNPRYLFEEFVIGPHNRFTAAAAQAVSDNPGRIYNPFFIYSSVGLGKTHLMHAVGHYVRKKNPSLKILYVTTEKFMSEVIDAIRQGTLKQMRDHYRQIDLLLVDDIQFLVESESTQEEFFHTFNMLHQRSKQIIITSDRPPKQLTTLEDRLRSRFEWGLIADIKAPNLETRVAILKKKEEIDKLELDDNILLYIASKLKSNIRELEGFLKRINAYATLTHQEVTMELVRSLMSDLLPAEEMADTPPPAPIPPAPAAPAPRIEISMPPPPVPIQPPPAAVILSDPEPVPQYTEQDITVINPKAVPPAPAPAPTMKMPAPPPEHGDEKRVEVAFFYPQAKDQELVIIKDRFREVIKKHKLKFNLEGTVEQAYECSDALSYPSFVDLCKKHAVAIAIVLGPPPDCSLPAEDFGNLLATVMEDEKISLQLVPWVELNKDYRYLNLALDITLLKHRL